MMNWGIYLDNNSISFYIFPPRQIDNNIDNVNVLRKDKWLVEGDLRRLV